MAKAVVGQKKNYEQAVSSVALFMHENFDNENKHWAEFFSVNRLYHIYLVWCKRNNKKPNSSNNFRDELRRVLGTKTDLARDKVEKVTVRGYRCQVREESEIKRVTDYSDFMDYESEYQEPPPFNTVIPF